MTKARQLSELRTKVCGMLSDPAIDDMQFVEWLEVYTSRAHEILSPPIAELSLDCPEADIRREYNRFGTGVSGQRVIEWAHSHGITLPKEQHWWFIRERQAEYAKGTAKESDLLENVPTTGYIHGVPNSNGYPRITNGIDVYIERFDGSLFLGHRDWLRWDRRAKNLEKLHDEQNPKAKKGLVQVDMAEVEKLLQLLNT